MGIKVVTMMMLMMMVMMVMMMIIKSGIVGFRPSLAPPSFASFAFVSFPIRCRFFFLHFKLGRCDNIKMANLKMSLTDPLTHGANNYEMLSHPGWH